MIQSLIKRCVSVMCITYTAIITFISLLNLVVYTEGTKVSLMPSKALAVLGFAAVVGLASVFLSKEGTSAIKLTVHFVLCTAGFILFMVVCGGLSAVGSTGITAVMLFFVIYSISMGVRAVFCSRYRRRLIAELTKDSNTDK